MKSPFGLKIFIAVVVAAVGIVAGIGVYFSGTPSQARAEKFDQQRINHLVQITSAMDNYAMANSKLPSTLDEFKNERYAYVTLTDPMTHVPYEYHVTSSTAYELCATFQTDNMKDNVMRTRPPSPFGFGNTWQHPVGKKCFLLTVNPLTEKRTPFVQ